MSYITLSLIKRSSAVISLSLVLLLHPVVIVRADDAPTPPTQPTAPTAPAQPQQPDQTQQTSPTSTPIPTQTGGNPSTSPPTPTTSTDKAQLEDAARAQALQQANGISGTPTPTGTQTTQTSNQTATSSGQPGSSNTNNVPANVSTTTGNGAGSNNGTSSQTNAANATTQNNSGNVSNGLNQSTVTGGNDASLNVGNATIQTGDANVSGTAITTLNTNANAIGVNEFNVNDNHNGDIVLDFTSHCISGCGGPDASNVVKNVANGAGSTNMASSSASNTTSTFQNNDATVGNNLTLKADSGHNTANDTTGGDTNITTGNANVSANALTFANNNIDGKIVYTTVNIYGNLVGDIVMPQSAIDAVNTSCATCSTASQTTNAGNASGSTDTASSDQNNNKATFQNNDATITNNLTLASTTGNNSENSDTGGNATVNSGNATTDAKILNVANANVDGGDMWLVIINKAGQWIGSILGAPGGATSAASPGTTLTTDNKGNVTASNSGNGAESTNTADNNRTSSNTTSQNNTATIANKLDLSANTGANAASNNTGGNSSIKTGNAHIIANIVNFANNNIKKGGKLFVTIVNVFGDWIGNFVGPGQAKASPSSSTVSNNTMTTPPIASPTPTPVSDNAITNGITAQTDQQIRSTNAPYYPNTSYRFSTDTIPANNRLAAVGFRQSGFPVQTGEIAGASTENRTIHINLAWLLIILPIAGIATLYRKKHFSLDH